MVEALRHAWTFLRCNGNDARAFSEHADARSIGLWALAVSAAMGLLFVPLAGTVSGWTMVVSFVSVPLSIVFSFVALVLILRITHRHIGWAQIQSAFFTLCILSLTSTFLSLLATGLYVLLGQSVWILAAGLLGLLIWTYMMYSRHLGAVLRVTPGQVFVIWFVIQLIRQGAERLIMT